MLKCPIDNTPGDCNQNCLFLRDDGCAIVLAAEVAYENKNKLNTVSQKLDDIASTLDRLITNLGFQGR